MLKQVLYGSSSRNHPGPLLQLFFPLLFVTVVSSCVDTTTNDVLLYEAPPESNIAPKVDAPGTGASGGPIFADFFLQDRRSGTLPGAQAFYQIRAERLAVTTNLVLYRQFNNPDGSFCSACNSHLNSTRAQQILNQLEPAIQKMRDIYGAGNRPDVQANGGRIVILAADIRVTMVFSETMRISQVSLLPAIFILIIILRRYSAMLIC